MPAPDELLLLAHETLEMRALDRGERLDFGDFLKDWQAIRVVGDTGRILSLWLGPDDARIALLCRAEPQWQILSVTDYSLSEFRASRLPRHASFLLPGWPLHHWGSCLADEGIFLGWWPALGGETGLRLNRQGAAVELRAEPSGFVLIDWSSAAAVDRFDGLALPGRGWVAPLTPWLPCDADRLRRSYARFCEGSAGGEDRAEGDDWAYDAFNVGGEDWADLVVAMLSVSDAERDRQMLLQFGAQIYANDAGFFERMLRELDAGTVQPEALGLVLAMERPEYFDDRTRIVFNRLVGRCGGQV